jgi:Ca2+-binding EF-hand superfamily protein
VSKEIDDEIKELFKKVDSDGSNKIEKDELRKVL